MLPNNPHDWAVWLHANLLNVHHVGDGQWEGRLPDNFDFKEIASRVDECGPLSGFPDISQRRIEFHPSLVNVYQTAQEFINKNHSQIPVQFTVRDIGYTSSAPNTLVPPLIKQHAEAISFWKLLVKMADHQSANGTSLLFIKSHDSKLDIRLEYDHNDLKELKGLIEFEKDFVSTDHHIDQKKNIVRSSLLEMYKGVQSTPFSLLLQRFDEFSNNVRNSYAMYVAEFSYEKIRAEIEKDNLDSTLKLNKTFSDIQNQLLALPVALVLVGGQMNPADGITLKNVVVWLGSLVFSFLMWMLITNQRHAIAAISEEINLRWQKIEKQPLDVRARFAPSFEALQKRRCKQDGLLIFVKGVVALSLAFSTGVLVWLSYEAQLQKLFCLMTNWLSKINFSRLLYFFQ